MSCCYDDVNVWLDYAKITYNLKIYDIELGLGSLTYDSFYFYIRHLSHNICDDLLSLWGTRNARWLISLIITMMHGSYIGQNTGHSSLYLAHF